MIEEMEKKIKPDYSKRNINKKFRTLKVKYVADKEEYLPKYATSGSAGCDLCAIEGGTIEPGHFQLIKTGLHFSIPKGFELQVRPRSGLALKHGVTCLNTPGTVDSDYRGDIGVILINFGSEPFSWEAGDRIAQGVFAKVMTAEFIKVDSLDETDRGEGGYGSSGIKQKEETTKTESELTENK